MTTTRCKLFTDTVLNNLLDAQKNMASAEKVDARGLIRLSRFILRLLEQLDDEVVELAKESGQVEQAGKLWSMKGWCSMKITTSEEGSLTGKVKPYLRVQYGDDGNPEVETTCIGIDATNLCTALVAALAANSADPEAWLIRVMTKAADLVSRVVNEEDKDNETVS